MTETPNQIAACLRKTSEPVTLEDVIDALNTFNRPKPNEDDGPWEAGHFIRVDFLPAFINIIAAAWFRPKDAVAALEAQAAQIATMQAREKACATMDEAKKRSLIRALQECCRALGLCEMVTSPAELVKAVSEQAAQIAERDAQIEALRADFAALQHAIVGDTGQSAILTAAVVKANADRYEWLREQCRHKRTRGSHIAANEYGDDWDEAIDAAMAARRSRSDGL